MHLLAGDVGGTKTRLAIYEVTNSGKLLERIHVERFASRETRSLSELVSNFLAKTKIAPAAACFGIPGPVIRGTVRVTNLPWELSEAELSKTLGVSKLKLINDLAATAAAIPHFHAEDLVTLHPGASDNEKTAFAVLAPGTGLGQGYLFFDGQRYHALPAEGGHVSFAPTNELQIEMLRFLNKKYGRTSNERVACGSGLPNIYEFLKASGFAKENPEVAARIGKEEPAVVIGEFGIAGKDALCVKALEVLAELIGQIAGDVMLSYMATGGVYLGGGVSPKLLPKLQEGPAVAAYLNKGPLSNAVRQAPLYVIRDDHAAVLGAASVALQMTQEV
jgi:glucokinase